ncbi:tetratricopeptide repeat protein [bacterium]|nr:tetratricopeptide repeat protein [bacterium]
MKTLQLFLIFGWIAATLLLFNCQKKQSRAFHESETQTIEVDVPRTDWRGTMTVASADTGLLSRVLTASLARRLKPQGFKIVTNALSDKSTADYVLDTKAVQNENQLEIAYTLRDVKTDSVYENRIIYEQEAVFTALEAVSYQVSQSLGDTSVQETQSGTVSDSIFQRFLKAESERMLGTPAALNRAVRQYKEILRQDSLFMEAWIGLAESYLILIEQGWERHHIWLSLAQQAGFKLQKWFPESGEGESILGRIALIRGDFRSAEDHFRQALEINKNGMSAWRGLGQIFGQYGLYEPALQMYERALELQPSDLQAGISKALILGGQGRHDESVILLNRLIAAHPSTLYLHSFLALQLYYLNQTEGARESVRLGLADASYQPFSHAVLAMILAKQGDLDSALSEVELEVKPRAEGNGSLATAVAAIYALLGRNGLAIQWLDHAVNWGYQEYFWLVNDPNFSGLQGDKRFQTICDTLKVVYEKRRASYLQDQVL